MTEKEALPPGSGSEVGSAVFVTRIELGVSLSSLVTVQVFVSPLAIEPVQSAEKLAAYPDGPDSETE